MRVEGDEGKGMRAMIKRGMRGHQRQPSLGIIDDNGRA
jgi:hypothetical protein